MSENEDLCYCKVCEQGGAALTRRPLPQWRRRFSFPMKFLTTPMHPVGGASAVDSPSLACSARAVLAVYKAIQQPVGRPVALVDRVGHRRPCPRDSRKRRVVAGLKIPPSSPSIVTVPSPTVPFMVFELIEGEHNKVLPKGTGWPPERAVSLMPKLNGSERPSNGVGASRFEAENIMVVQGGAGGDKAKVLDFGIAKVVGCDDEGLRTVALCWERHICSGAEPGSAAR